MLAVAVLFGVALVVTLILLARAYRLIHSLESILADADDRVRALELELSRQRNLFR